MNRRKLIGSLIGLPGILSLGRLMKLFPSDVDKNWKWSDLWSHDPEHVHALDTISDEIMKIDWAYIDGQMEAFSYFEMRKAGSGRRFMVNAVTEYLKNDIEVVYRGGISKNGYYAFADDGMVQFHTGDAPINVVTKKLHVKWSPEFQEALSPQQAWKGQRELSRLLVEYVGEELKRRPELLKDGKLLCWGIFSTPLVMDRDFIPRKGLLISVEL